MHKKVKKPGSKKYIPVIGLEIHVEIATKSKMFCGCQAAHFAKKPNSQTCPVCLGLPGALPIPNRTAIEWAIMIGLALNCKVNEESKFDRKHYFYPDLPKGYQISQYDQPLTVDGQWLMADGRKIGIRRVHLEEDTGKLVHATVDDKKVSLVDFNRSGVALVEIVTEPDFDSAEGVLEFSKELQRIIRYLRVSDCDMEKGSMRLEANISLRESSAHKAQRIKLPNYKVELKNINSFRFMKKAIEKEIERQAEVLYSGGRVVQETRGYNEAKGITFSQRVKEEEQDYRYFPEPDIPPFKFSAPEIAKLKKLIQILPQDYRKAFGELALPQNYIEVLVEDRRRAEYFVEALSLGKKHGVDAKTTAGLIVNQDMDKEFEQPAGLIRKIVQLTKVDYASHKAVEKAIDKVVGQNPDAVRKYKLGKTQVLGFLIGAVQKVLQGTGNPSKISDLLRSALK